MDISGSVKFYDQLKGYGFIVAPDGAGDVMVHAAVVRAFGLSKLNAGDDLTVALADVQSSRRAASIVSYCPRGVFDKAIFIIQTMADADPDEGRAAGLRAALAVCKKCAAE